MKNLAHSASLDSKVETAPLMSGIKHLVRELVGWAIDHHVGMAVQSIPPVPQLPVSEKGRKKRDVAKSEADSHQHEAAGATVADGSVPDFALRDVLAVIMQANVAGLAIAGGAFYRQAPRRAAGSVHHEGSRCREGASFKDGS